MYRIDVRSLVRNKLFICRDYHIQPSEIDRMAFYEYEYMLEDVKQVQKEQEKENERQQKEHDSMRHSMNPNTMMRNMSQSMPNMSNMKLPTMTVPKL